MAKKKIEQFDDDYEFATFEDIQSTTFVEPSKKNVLDYLKVAEDFYLNNLGKIIKIASFVVAAAILLMFIALGAVLIMLDSFFTFIAIILFVVGLVAALISMLIIFGLGQIINQNDEILNRFNKK